MKMYVARDERDTGCHLHVKKPTKYYDKYQCRWKWLAEPYHAYLVLPDSEFKEVTFEDGPIEVELVIKK